MGIRLNTNYLSEYVGKEEFANIFPQVLAAHDTLHKKQGAGSDFLGWLDLPHNYDKEEFARIKKAAVKVQKSSEVLVVIGIGGSYLGARAVIEAVKSVHYNALCQDTPQIYFAGNSVSPSALQDVISLCENKDFSVNIISKSGTTTEPAIAFRVFRNLLEKKYGKSGAKERIFATTDRARGTLKELADAEGYETFVVPDDVGGRYSVLTAVGLLPLAVAGIDIDAMMQGAADAMEALSICDDQNDCYRYAAARNILRNKGKTVELMASFEPDFAMMNEWYKQLFGESEGKDQKGIFPASVVFSTDLHSMGQYIQDGRRILFETMVDIKNSRQGLKVVASEDGGDGLDFLTDRSINEVNHKAMQGTILAHSDGGVPVLVLEMDSLAAKDMGYLVYFFEKACAISGYMLGVNPFDQPGVESYKKNMFALLGKPGYEAQKAELEKRISK
ncbi:MAG: glucose-6-phosphate isomerase [Oscillospiraceae bacterium]